MIVFLARRLVFMLLTMLAVSIILFAMLEVNVESIAVRVLGAYSTDTQREIWLEANGYLRPIYVRYIEWLGNFLVGDFGESTRFNTRVADILWPRLGNTGLLALFTFGIMIPISLTLGVFAGMREGSRTDRSITFLSVITTSVPEFASAVLLSFIFVFWLGILPGTSGFTDGFSLREMILPVMVLIIYDFGYVARMTRASMAEVMQSPIHSHRRPEGHAVPAGGHEARAAQRADRALHGDRACSSTGCCRAWSLSRCSSSMTALASCCWRRLFSTTST